MELKDFLNHYLLPQLAEDFKGKVDLEAMFESVYKALDKANAVCKTKT